MSQAEILQVLNDLRAKSDNWYNAHQIIDKLKDNKITKGSNSIIYKQLLQLTIYKVIECRGVGYWNHHKEFRGMKE